MVDEETQLWDEVVRSMDSFVLVVRFTLSRVEPVLLWTDANFFIDDIN